MTNDCMYLVLARFAMDDVPVGLFSNVEDAERCANLLSMAPADAAAIADRLLDVQPSIDDGFPSMAIVEMQRGYPARCVEFQGPDWDEFQSWVERAWNQTSKEVNG